MPVFFIMSSVIFLFLLQTTNIYGAVQIDGTVIGKRDDSVYVKFQSHPKARPVVGDKVYFSINHDGLNIEAGEGKIIETESTRVWVQTNDARPDLKMKAVIHATGSVSTPPQPAASDTKQDLDVEGQFEMAKKYHFGHGVPVDKETAFKWYYKAAVRGHGKAQNNLGALYEYGDGVAENVFEAEKWYRKAANQELDFAQYNLARLYDYGTGIGKNDVKAVTWYRKAADQGHANAQCDLGMKYFYGHGTSKDIVEAIRWLRESAEQNNPRAQHFLGQMYDYGKGIEKNHLHAVKWYRKAADQGYEDSQKRLNELQ